MAAARKHPSSTKQRTRPEDSTSITLTHNLIYWRRGALLAGAWESPGVTIARIGFVPFDPGAAGVYGDKSWVRFARRTTSPKPDAPVDAQGWGVCK